MSIAVITVGVLVVILVVWQTIQLQAIRKRVDAVPADENTIALMQRLNHQAMGNATAIAALQERLDRVDAKLPLSLSRMGVVAYDAFGNITGNPARLAAQFLNNRGDPICIYIVDGHPGVFSDKRPGNCLTDTVAGSGYQNFFFLKSQN